MSDRDRLPRSPARSPAASADQSAWTSIAGALASRPTTTPSVSRASDAAGLPPRIGRAPSSSSARTARNSAMSTSSAAGVVSRRPASRSGSPERESFLSHHGDDDDHQSLVSIDFEQPTRLSFSNKATGQENFEAAMHAVRQITGLLKSFPPDKFAVAQSGLDLWDLGKVISSTEWSLLSSNAYESGEPVGEAFHNLFSSYNITRCATIPAEDPDHDMVDPPPSDPPTDPKTPRQVDVDTTADAESSSRRKAKGKGRADASSGAASGTKPSEGSWTTVQYGRPKAPSIATPAPKRGAKRSYTQTASSSQPSGHTKFGDSSLEAVAKALPGLSINKLMELYNTSAASGAKSTSGSMSGRDKKCPRFVTQGLSRRLLIVSFSTPTTPTVDCVEVAGRCNVALRQAKVELRVEHICTQDKIYIVSCTNVPTPAQTSLIEGCWAKYGLSEFIGQWAITPPSSKAFLKLIDVPRFKGTGADRTKVTPADMESGLVQAAFASKLSLAGPPRISPTSQNSDTAVAYFNVWDSQSGTRAMNIIGRTFYLFGKVVKILMAEASLGTPLCTRCWRWGHPTIRCRTHAPRCKKCGEPHAFETHRDAAGCCKGNAKANPPIKSTPASQPCPHKERCLNCRGEHLADSRKCWFWGKRFDRAEIMKRYTEVCAGARAPFSNANTSPS